MGQLLPKQGAEHEPGTDKQERCSLQASTNSVMGCNARERDKTLTEAHPFSQGATRVGSHGITMQ